MGARRPRAGIVAPVATDTLAGRYKAACATPSDIYEHLPGFVTLCAELQATKVIELGTRSGVSTIAWLYGLEGRGHLWSVDIDDRPDIGTHDHWTFIQGDDTDPDIYTQLPSGVDVVFIDTNHTYDQTVAELNLYRWLVRPGGRIVLHDTELARPKGVHGPAWPVKRAVTDWATAEGLEWTNTERCFGLAVITVT